MKKNQSPFFLSLITFLLIVFGTYKTNYANEVNDSISNYNKFKTHVLTLDFISRKTNNSKYFLKMASKYCDSILMIGKDSSWAQSFKERIELTLVTCENNMNHRVQLFPYFNGFPTFMGFADDAIEYAYDNTLEELFNTTFKKIHVGPLSEANLCSIVIRGDCDDEMFEIVKQTIMGNTSHYVITKDDLEKTLGIEKSIEITNGLKDTAALNLICKAFNLEQLGVFDVSNLDDIDEKIWLVESKFSTYSPEDGFTEAVFSRGFSHDKRGVLGLNVLLLIIESILFIALISVLDEKIIKLIRTGKLFSIKDTFVQFVRKIKC